MKIKSVRNIPNPTVVKVLENLERMNIELTQLAIRVKEYAKRFSKCARAEELVAKLKELGLDDVTAVVIANIVPQTPDEVRVIYDKRTKPLDNETIKKILDLTALYCVEEQ